MNGTMYLPPSSVADDTELCSMTNIDSNHSYFSQSGDKWMIMNRGGGCSFVKKVILQIKFRLSMLNPWMPN